MLKCTQIHETKGQINRRKIYGGSRITEKSWNLKQMDNAGVFWKSIATQSCLALLFFSGHLILAAFGVSITRKMDVSSYSIQSQQHSGTQSNPCILLPEIFHHLIPIPYVPRGTVYAYCSCQFQEVLILGSQSQNQESWQLLPLKKLSIPLFLYDAKHCGRRNTKDLSLPLK